MKLTIKRKWFNKIKNEQKKFELRDAHITFIADDNGEQLTLPIIKIELLPHGISQRILDITNKEFRSMFDDNKQICFYLGDKDKGVTHGKAQRLQDERRTQKGHKRSA